MEENFMAKKFNAGICLMLICPKRENTFEGMWKLRFGGSLEPNHGLNGWKEVWPDFAIRAKFLTVW